MTDTASCPVCSNQFGGTCTEFRVGNRDGLGFDCSVCGRFAISRTALADTFSGGTSKLTDIQWTAMSHALRANRTDALPFILTDWIERFLVDARLPNAAEQATNIIRVIGDYVARTGYPMSKPPIGFFAEVGARNPDAALKLTRELIDRGLLTGIDAGNQNSRYATISIDLTLDGWNAYEEQRKGLRSGGYGFAALKFGDPILDPFLVNVIKPAVREIRYDLIDLRDVAQAGVIDNILRMTIRDAAFVLVDLTHDNAGAYWEAGFAEGLGKPVIYLCEQSKFSEARTHFDTNHCTTVMWDVDQPGDFRRNLIATLRNSLKLFEAA